MGWGALKSKLHEHDPLITKGPEVMPDTVKTPEIATTLPACQALRILAPRR